MNITATIFNSCRAKQGERKIYTWEEMTEAFRHPHRISITAKELLQLHAEDRQKETQVKDTGGYILGETKNNLRTSNSIINRSGLVYDFDRMTLRTAETITDRLRNQRINFILHSTAKHTKDSPRLRLIVPLSKPVPASKYEYIAKSFAYVHKLPEDDDPASFQASRLIFFPAVTSDQQYIYESEYEDDFVNPDCALPHPDFSMERIKALPEANNAVQVDMDPPVTCEISDADAIAMVRAQVELDREHIDDRQNWYIPAFMAIIKAVQINQISYQAGLECVAALADGNTEWEAGNIEQFEREVKKTQPKTEYDFLDKFDFRGLHDVFEPQYKDLLKPTNAEDLLKTEFEPLTEYVKGFIVPGLTILSAPPKSGKSWLTLDMCMAIVTGKDFLEMETIKAPVLYLGLEDSARRLKRRIRTLGGVFLNPETLKGLDIVFNAPPLQVPKNKSRMKLTAENDLLMFLEPWVQKGKKVIVIDVFQKVRIDSGNTNMYKAEYDELGRLQQWAQKNKIAVVLVHHFKKGTQGTDPVERIGGSTGLSGSADTLIMIEKEKRSDKNALFMVTGRDVDMREFICSFNNGTWTYENEAEEQRAENNRIAYENNPIVKTIKHHLKNADEYRRTSTEFRNDMIDLIGFDAKDIKVDKRVFDNISGNLHVYDKITYYQIRTQGSRMNVFSTKKK